MEEAKISAGILNEQKPVDLEAVDAALAAEAVKNTRKIIVLDDGEMAGIGTHSELLSNCGVYQEIYYSQYPDEKTEV